MVKAWRERGRATCVTLRKTLTNIQIKRINFMGGDSKQNVEASVRQIV